MMIPLFEALTGKPKKLVWNNAMVKAFRDTMKALAEATLLTHPRQNAPALLTPMLQTWQSEQFSNSLLMVPGYL